MVGINQARRGRTVYSGGSFAPTKGPVSGQGAQGYIQREVRNGNRGLYGGVSKFGRDGQSDTRSGVAQRAMNRWGGKWAGQEGKPGFQGNVKPPGGGNGGGGNAAQPQPTIQGTGAPVGGAAQPAAPSPATPTVTVSDSGLLELPYNAAWSQDTLGMYSDTNDELLNIQKEQQAAAADYALQKKMAGEGYVDQQRNTLNSDSGRGMAFSSGHAYNVGTDANNYNNLTNSLDTGYASQNAEFDTRRTTARNAFSDYLRRTSLENADVVDDDAGNLGYGDPGPRENGPLGNASGNKIKVPKAYQQPWKAAQTWKPPAPPKKPDPPKKPTPNKPGGKK